jgi:hypothetical protein
MLDLKQFESRCHEIFGRGTIQDFDRSARRRRYFSAWRRSINLRLGMWDFPGLVYARDGARYRANWEEYLRTERAIQDEAERSRTESRTEQDGEGRSETERVLRLPHFGDAPTRTDTARGPRMSGADWREG